MVATFDFLYSIYTVWRGGGVSVANVRAGGGGRYSALHLDSFG